MTRPRRVRALWARASLRSRVLLLAVALLTVGFTAFALVTGNALRGYMEDRLDAQLRATAQVFAVLPPTVAESGTQRKPPAGLADFSTDILGNPVVTYVAKDGTVERSIDSLAGANRTSNARGPALPRLDTAAVAAREGRPFTVGSTKGDARWRVLSVPRVARAALPGTSVTTSSGPGSVVVATSMDQVDGTVGRMWQNYRTTGLGLLAVLAVAGWFAVRSGLRPLSRVEQTAAEIAGGDLSRRVPELAGPRTELGRLAAALNGMLGQLESAFAARAESEARMSRFVADASHELRTPLAGIKGLTDLHRMGALAEREDVDATMDRIARESERLTRLVEDMLLLARLDEQALKTTGKPAGSRAPGCPPDLDLTPADLRTLAADALHDVRALDPARTVTLTGPVGDGPPAPAPALADEARLRQVVTNLVGNAVAHTPPGTPLRIGVGTVGGHAVLEVADEGPGLTPEQSGRIFERFYRADTSRNRATGGAGLGLSIVHSLVTAHAGHVEVDSTPGRGATFRVLLPRLPDRHMPTSPPEAAALQR
ncbi:HAMP domain-containing sensor histidine kinase [Streptomyces aurantiogriseus]|uniref:histidine kinase n=1 Tax=Streptomyces aurantiogriseus TaxID=66870 RepID=A0A918FA01_9ACTN|nr:HAMP domain-containing sensor histidine kinase [Streptomyces aurantiogriseus]GGR15376.1 two-component sensor histidine kinase [Streptomyces aurantiogriseus]